MGEIRSPYFSTDRDYFGDNPEIHSPYLSYGGDYHGDNSEIHSPYFSSAGDYLGDKAEIHSETISENQYNAEQFIDQQDIVQNLYTAQPFIAQEFVSKPYSDLRLDIPISEDYISEDFPKSSVCIYRVPGALRESNEPFFTPREISIGPIHHGKKALEAMQTRKRRYYSEFWNRLSNETEWDENQENFWKVIKEDEGNIRQCYELDGSYQYSFINESQTFRKIIMLDAVFIFELFLRYTEGVEQKKYEKDSILSKPWLRMWIRRDLMLLENQLPFFILERLYELLPISTRGKYPAFINLACFYFGKLFKSTFDPDRAKRKPLHFTDLVRSLLSFNQKLKSEEPIKSFYSATKLHQAGIKFKDPQQYDCLLDVKFNTTRIELSIPQLDIDGNTERLFRNLMALEKSCYPGKEYICHYVKLLEILVAEPKDAKLLIENKIIIHNDGAAVKSLIDKLSSQTSEDYSCYYSLYLLVDSYYHNSWTKNRAYFREVYFGNLWRGTATISATILLILSFVQALCSVLSLR